MKTILILIATCICLSAGGVAIIYINGDNVMSMPMWRIAFRGVVTSPGVILGEALRGSDTAFFGGIFVAVSGALAAGLLAASVAVFGAVGSLVRVVRRATAGRSERSSVADAPKEKIRKGRGARKAQGLRRAIASSAGGIRRMASRISAPETAKKRAFVDRDAGLEDEPAKEKGEGLIAKLRRAIESRRATPEALVISSAGREEAVVEVEDGSVFVARLQEWYARIKTADKNDPACIADARSLREKASRKARDAVVEEDAMNGVFMLRMMDAWAGKMEDDESAAPAGAASSEPGETPQDEDVFSRAISDVMETGIERAERDSDFDAADIDDDSEDFILDDVGASEFILEDDDPDGEEAGEEMLEAEADGGNEVEPEDGESGGGFVLYGEGEGGDPETVATGELRSIGIARMVCDLTRKAAAVAASEEEWDEDMAGPELRIAHVDEMFDALSGAFSKEAKEISEMSSFDADGDQKEIDWLQENGERLDAKRAALKEAVAPAGEAGSEDVDDDDLEALFGISGQFQEGDESGAAGDPELDEIVDAAGSGGGPDEGVEGPGGEAPDAVPEVDRDAGEASIGEEREGDGAESAESVEADAQDEAGSEDAATDDEAGIVEAPEADERAPRDLTIPDLEEVERCGEILFGYGVGARQAGAAEARISHSLLSKDGLRRRVVGVAHLVAGWRQKHDEESRRMHLVLRYLGEGDWTLAMPKTPQDGVRMVDTNGDFVQISGEMLSHEDMGKGVVVIHFYGPGAPDDLLVEKGNLVICSEALSVDKMSSLMKR